MPWWVWVLLLIVAFVWLGLRAARAWRASVRGEFLDYLKREAPEIQLVREHERELELKMPDGSEGTLRLDRFFAEATRIRAEDAPGREDLFARFVKMLREGGASLPLDAGRDRERVRPRLVTDAHLRVLRGEVKERALPALACGIPGLSVVLVLDSESAVAYLTGEHLAELELTAEQALELALDNLSRSFDRDVVRRALADGSVNVVKSFDSFDAARILLVPACLQQGEQLAALIPDRDTLVLTAVPADGDWSSLRKLARAADGDPLWREPLLVRPTGISPVEA